MLVFSLLALAESLPTPRLILLGVAAHLGAVTASLGGRPPRRSRKASQPPCSPDMLRVCAAAALGLALARQGNSLGAWPSSSLPSRPLPTSSVVAGPTRGLVRKDSPVLDFLLVTFPTFDQPLGFPPTPSTSASSPLPALATSPCGTPDLRLGCTTTYAAMLVGLLLGTYLPALLLFIALSFVLADADLAIKRLPKRGK